MAEKAQMKQEKLAKQEHNKQKKLHRVIAPKVFAKAAGFGMSSERKIKEAAQLLRDDAKDEQNEKSQVIFVVRHQPRGNLSPAIEKLMTLLKLRYPF